MPRFIFRLAILALLSAPFALPVLAQTPVPVPVPTPVTPLISPTQWNANSWLYVAFTAATAAVGYAIKHFGFTVPVLHQLLVMLEGATTTAKAGASDAAKSLVATIQAIHAHPTMTPEAKAQAVQAITAAQPPPAPPAAPAAS